jgi:hypothetical protein
MFSCFFSSSNISGQYFSQHLSSKFPLRGTITGNYKKSNRLRCIDSVEYDLHNLARNLMEIKVRSYGNRGEGEIFRKKGGGTPAKGTTVVRGT